MPVSLEVLEALEPAQPANGQIASELPSWGPSSHSSQQAQTMKNWPHNPCSATKGSVQHMPVRQTLRGRSRPPLRPLRQAAARTGLPQPLYAAWLNSVPGSASSLGRCKFLRVILLSACGLVVLLHVLSECQTQSKMLAFSIQGLRAVPAVATLGI